MGSEENIHGPKRKEMKRRCRHMCDKELHNFYCSINIVRVINIINFKAGHRGLF